MGVGTTMTSKWRRIGAAVAVSAAAVAGPVMTAAPAGATNQTQLHPEWVDGCPGCPGPVLWYQSVLEQRLKDKLNTELGKGLSGLAVAAQRKDQRLHDASIKTIQGAVATAGNAAFAAGDWDGDLCPRIPWPFPGPRPVWDSAEKLLSQGLTEIARANISGDRGVLGQAVKDLDGGVAGFSALQGCV
jgi:hypothetical protein